MTEYAWYCGNAGIVPQTRHARSVGQKKPNAWGLFDVHGNAWEWCQDWYEESYYLRSPRTDPTGPTDDEYRAKHDAAYRVLRGGAWSYYTEIARSAYRGKFWPFARHSAVGFRVTMDF